jgi:hypothetical protein
MDAGDRGWRRLDDFWVGQTVARALASQPEKQTEIHTGIPTAWLATVDFIGWRDRSVRTIGYSTGHFKMRPRYDTSGSSFTVRNPIRKLDMTLTI